MDRRTSPSAQQGGTPNWYEALSADFLPGQAIAAQRYFAARGLVVAQNVDGACRCGLFDPTIAVASSGGPGKIVCKHEVCRALHCQNRRAAGSGFCGRECERVDGRLKHDD